MTDDEEVQMQLLAQEAREWQVEAERLRKESELSMSILKDAKRYRWAIKRVAFTHFLNSVFGVADKPWDKPTTDAKIDEAMKDE